MRSPISWIRLPSLAALALVLAVSAGAKQAAQAADAPHPGTAAPDFTLSDLEGNSHTLSSYKGKVVVLEWFNPGCPYVKAYYAAPSAMLSIQTQSENPSVVWLRVNSGAPGMEGADPEENRKQAADWGISTPILTDSDGTVGHAYGAAHTPEIVVIDPSGMIVYRGAPDEGGMDGHAGSGRGFVSEAIQAALNGEKPMVMETRAVGCSVKYAKKP